MCTLCQIVECNDSSHDYVALRALMVYIETSLSKEQPQLSDCL